MDRISPSFVPPNLFFANSLWQPARGEFHLQGGKFGAIPEWFLSTPLELSQAGGGRGYFVNKNQAVLLNFFFLSFFCLRGRSLSLPRDFTVCTVTLPVLRVFHCERCRIRTRDHCLSSLERYQWATTSPTARLLRHWGNETFPESKTKSW